MMETRRSLKNLYPDKYFFNLFINSVGRDKQGSVYICRQYQIPEGNYT